jgi:hypothetical protein
MGVKTHELVQKNKAGEDAHYAWLVWCPACNAPHSFDSRWTFNGNHEAPTFRNSMLVHENSGNRPRCHSFMTDGVWNYCADSTHEHKGQRLPAPDWAETRWAKMRPDGSVPA